MSSSLFTSCQVIANYEQAELQQQFALLAKATAGNLDATALKLGEQTQELIGNLRWQNYFGEIHLQRSWAIMVITRLYLPKATKGRIRVTNVYGEASGMPLTGTTRIDANWSLSNLLELFPPKSFRQLAQAQEPFTLVVQQHQVSLRTYRFYSSDFYLAALAYLADLAERILTVRHPDLEKMINHFELPWSQEL